MRERGKWKEVERKREMRDRRQSSESTI